jgi:cytochrome oxidase Cu insertion factor (SCO1/SenC/PrrC family)
MKFTNKSIIAITILLTFLIGVLPARAAVMVGDEAPDFTLTDANGKIQQLSAYRDTVVVLFFLGYN